MSSQRPSVLVVGVGASRGLGAAIVRRFARGGHPVAIAGRNAEKLTRTTRELEETGARVAHIIGDAARAEDAKHFVTEAERLAPLAGVLHNAGRNEPAPVLQLTDDSLTRHRRAHALGGFPVGHAARPG